MLHVKDATQIFWRIETEQYWDMNVGSYPIWSVLPNASIDSVHNSMHWCMS